MRALTFRGVEDVRCDDVPAPRILEPTDAVVRVTCAAICGSDLHVYHGRETGLDPGTVLGHEFVGVVEEIGSPGEGPVVGDRVAVPFSTACGECPPCRAGLSARCGRGQLFGWVENGVGLPGGQAEYVRVPLARSSLVALPSDIDDEVGVLLGDVLATGYYAARRAEIAPGATVAVVGCGPVGLLAITAALDLGAGRVFALDRVPARLARAEAFGADPLDVAGDDVRAAIDDATEGQGVDAVLEAVGSASSLRTAYEIVRAGGVLSVVGVLNESKLPITPAECYDKNLTIRMGRCPARSLMEELIPVIRRGRHDYTSLFTHRMGLAEGPHGYRIFAGREDGCVKVLLRMP